MRQAWLCASITLYGWTLSHATVTILRKLRHLPTAQESANRNHIGEFFQHHQMPNAWTHWWNYQSSTRSTRIAHFMQLQIVLQLVDKFCGTWVQLTQVENEKIARNTATSTESSVDPTMNPLRSNSSDWKRQKITYMFCWRSQFDKEKGWTTRRMCPDIVLCRKCKAACKMGSTNMHDRV